MKHTALLLVTGFEPFGGQSINPSWLAVSALPDELCGVPLVRRLLPVDWAAGPAALRAALDELSPAAVLCVGQAGGRAKLSIERVALNLRGGADNAGVACEESPIDPDGPTALLSSVPVRAMLGALERAGIPAEYSYTAGIYLCNCVLYTALRSPQAAAGMRAGFLHVPFLSEQTDSAPSMSREMLLRGVRTCAEAIAREV